MKFRKYSILGSLQSQRNEIRRTLKILNPHIIEVQPEFADDETLKIATDEEVLEFYNSGGNEYAISLNCLKELFSAKMDSIPVTEMNRHLISIVLHNKFISFVGFKEQKIFDLVKMTILLGGAVSPVVEDVDLVICNTAVPWSHIKIRRYEVPIVTKEWLENVYETRIFQPTRDYLLPVFSGWTVTSTDLTPSDSQTLKEIITRNGGFWQSMYDNNVVFLVAKNLLPTKKIWAAILSRVPIIHPSVIFDYEVGHFEKPFESYVLNPWIMSSSVERIFEGFTFKVSPGISESEALCEIVQIYGGRIGDPCTHYVVPHGSPESILGSAVSVNWVLACIEERASLPVSRNVIYSPVRFPVPVPEIVGKTFSLFHINDSERPTLSQIVRIFGGNVVYRLHKTASFVITSDSDDKVMKWSRETGIMVLHQSFLIHILRTGQVPDPSAFRINEDSKSRLARLCEKIKNTKSEPHIAAEIEQVSRYELEQFTQEFSQTKQPTEVSYEPQRIISLPEFSQRHDPLFAMFDEVGQSNAQM